MQVLRKTTVRVNPIYLSDDVAENESDNPTGTGIWVPASDSLKTLAITLKRGPNLDGVALLDATY